ncbi:hypothetical protein [Solimonas terrae]|uniref:Uncharacterized protein n=1 Tax=Solimonas terrae TaxID=1396819 RepID=A0A6M2BUM8_9GAMM|nr:hypothetical protein [Solimonas terrae]NGY06084.1 hypothetical protein [Solimonas terrae]
MFQQVEFKGLSKLSLILRVGGSLGEFAPEPKDGHPVVEREVLICNVVIRDHAWEKRSNSDIKAIVASHLQPGMGACCQFLELNSELSGQVLGALAQLAVQRDGPASGGSAR